MIHASPFFESALTGEWAETTDLHTPVCHTQCSSELSRSSKSVTNTFTTNLSNPPVSPPNQFTQLPAHSDWFERELSNQSYGSSGPQTPTLSSSPSLGNLRNLAHSNSPSRSQSAESRHLDSILHRTRSIELSQSTDPIQHAQNRTNAQPRATENITSNDEAEQQLTTSADEPSTASAVSNQQIDGMAESGLPHSRFNQSTHQLHPSSSSNSLSTLLHRKPGVTSDAQDRTAPQRTQNRHQIEARIDLKEEHDASFQDLLMLVYPHLECVCTWHNASDLMTMSQKFDMPLLKRHVLNFLLSSVAGKPIEAMKIAEEHQLPELYRESSRFLLDNWQGWDHKELESLSSQTLLKLEKRRTWFLERLLKLGLVNSSRDYVCPPSCPDPQHCTKLVDDKWRSAWAASFKFGPPQPSSVYRALRCLEPSLHSPALLLPHTSCQQHALRFFADLFDRMFSQFTPRGVGGGVNASNPSTNSNAAALTGIINPNSPNPNANPIALAGVEQQPAQPHIGNAGATASNAAGGTPATGANSNNTASFAITSSSGSSHILNSEKPIRKAKYFLHVELFENNEKLKRRFE